MPDHLHILVEGQSQTSDLKKFASLFKQKSGYWFRYHNDNVGQGFSFANKTSLKVCPTENHKDGDVGQGFSLAEDQATLKGCPTENEKKVNVGRDFSPADMRGDELWQINYYEHVLRSDEATESVAQYILDNPVRKGLAEDFRDYPFSRCEVNGFVGQGFSPANQASLKACPTENHKDGDVGQGFSLANADDQATMKGRPPEETPSTPKGLPYKSEFVNLDLETRGLKSRGFTLIEIVITIVIVGIIAGVAAMIIAEGVRAYSNEQSRSDAHYQARLAVERMARETRLIRSQTAGDMPTMAAADLIFCDVTGKAIEFQLAGTVLNRRESATCSPLAWGGWNSLATGVTPFTISYFQQDGVTVAAATNLWYVVIDVTDTQGTETLEIRTRVHPRNF